ncbi:MAG: sigma-70 family RNA polymerase sigma factor [Planctomycetaceae bacterium]
MLSPRELAALWNRHAAALLLMARTRCGQVAGGMAEDCVQETFVRLAAQEIPPQDPAAWLARCVRNAAIDAVRSQQRRLRREQFVAAQQPPWLDPSGSLTGDGPSTTELQNALRQLDDETRDIVVAHLWNDMTFRQIADAFDTSPATAHRRYEAGLHQLRSLISAESFAQHDVKTSDVRNLQ